MTVLIHAIKINFRGRKKYFSLSYYFLLFCRKAGNIQGLKSNDLREQIQFVDFICRSSAYTRDETLYLKLDVQSESWLRQFARRHARVSHATPAGLLAEILARIARSSRENGRIRGGTRDLGQSSLYSTLLSWLLSRGRVFYLPVPVSHSSHSGPCAIAFPNSSENRYNA